ncbi:MAG: SDR family NAD(P)-dependent oxidoreductase [Pseudomonadota bacterium]
MSKFIAITGASGGIGKSMAHVFASNGHNLILAARRGDLLDESAEKLRTDFGVDVRTFSVDLTEVEAVGMFYEAIRDLGLHALINNAGLGDFSHVWEMNLDKASQIVALNMNAVTQLSLRFVADYCDDVAVLMNVSSIAGYTMYSGAVPYCASKFYVSAFTEGVHLDLSSAGKPMSAKVLCPGPTASDFFSAGSIGSARRPFEDASPDTFLSTEQLAVYAYELFKSDHVVGIVDPATHRFELSHPKFETSSSTVPTNAVP